ncbi:MAG: mechanosensitive ion channel domain-containing protein [Sphingomonadaceae bacterium]
MSLASLAAAAASASPTAGPSPTATPTGPPAEQAWSLAQPLVNQGQVAAAQEIKQAVTQKSETIGDIVNTLDSWAIDIGKFHLSVWDVIIVLGVIVLCYMIGRLGSRLGNTILKRITKLDSTQQLLAEKLVSIAIWSAAFFLGIDLLGIDLTALAVFSGAFGLAIGFGLQKTFGNLIAGIILLMDKSIKPGDVIAIADAAGNSTFGQIRKIGVRAVSLVTRDQKEYLIPNENLMINQVENWSYSSKNVRVHVPVGVSYNADLNLAEKLMLEAAKSCDRVLKSPPPIVWLKEYGDSSVNFSINCWISDPEEGVSNVQSAVLKKLWWLFKEANVEIPFPQRDINLRNNDQFERLIEALAARVAAENSTGGAKDRDAD